MRYALLLALFILGCEGPVGPMGPAGPEGPAGSVGEQGPPTNAVIVFRDVGAENVNGGFGAAFTEFDVPEITHADSSVVIAHFQTRFLATRDEWVVLPFDFSADSTTYHYNYRYGNGAFQLHASSSPAVSIDGRNFLLGRVKIIILPKSM